MKKTLLFTLLIAAVMPISASASTYKIFLKSANIEIPTSNIDEFEPNSCKSILDAGKSTGNGVYSIIVNNQEFNVFCNMETDGGGWTMVVAQFESNPMTNWNEGIQFDYDPSLSSSQSFSLNSEQIPNHTQTGFGKSFDPTFLDYANITYHSGNIDVTNIVGVNTGLTYQIHRNTNSYYSNHDPENNSLGDYSWSNTLTIDALGGAKYSWSFSPQHSNVNYRGYSINGQHLPYSSDSFAWTVWIR